MPREGLSVYFSGVDQMSPVLATIADKTKALDKASQELQQTYASMQKANQSLIAQRTELKSSLEEQKNRVAELRAEYKKYGDDMSGLKLRLAIEEQDSLKDTLKEVEDQLKANRKAYIENREEIRKGLIEGDGSGLGGEAGLGKKTVGLGDMAEGIFAGQIGQMFASSLGGLGESVLTSAIGTPEASLIADTLSGIISGGAAGAMFGIPGIMAGAALGGASGLISGNTKIFEAQDDAFKDYYGGLYEDVKDRSGEMVEGGSSIASGRETDRISFRTLFGDEETADTYLENLVDMANHTPFLYGDLTAMSKTLATYGYSPDEDSEDYILDALQTIGDTGAALGMGTGDMTAVAQALGRMKSSDKATLEYLNILNDRGIGAVGYLAEAKGVSQGDMYSMISKGEISGTEAVEIITEALQGAYFGAMEDQSQTFSGITSTLEGLEQELENARGDAYNTLRQSGKSDMVAAYDGELGEALKEINTILGENQARKENLQDQYMREVQDAVFTGNRGELWSDLNDEQQNRLTAMHDEYVAALERYNGGDEDAGIDLKRLYDETQALGKAYFDNSDYVQKLNEAELDEIDAIREATLGLAAATDASYYLSQELSKGLGTGGWNPGAALDDFINETLLGARPKGSGARTRALMNNVLEESRSHAFGLERVPYDEYPALLHQDERVLTASEARAQDAGAPAPIQLTITGNSFSGTSEEMADQLWEIIMRKLEQAYTAAAPK